MPFFDNLDDREYRYLMKELEQCTKVEVSYDRLYIDGANHTFTVVNLPHDDILDFITRVSNGDFPSVKCLEAYHETFHDEILVLVRSPRSSVKKLVVYNIYRDYILQGLCAALSDPHTTIREYECNFTADYLALGLDVERIMKVHKARDLLFVLRRRFSKDILWNLAFLLL
jgi:hypothetical protein